MRCIRRVCSGCWRIEGSAGPQRAVKQFEGRRLEAGGTKCSSQAARQEAADLQVRRRRAGAKRRARARRTSAEISI